MKKIIFVFLAILFSVSGCAQVIILTDSICEQKLNRSTLELKEEANLLYIIDGVQLSSDFDIDTYLKNNEIVSLEVLKDLNAVNCFDGSSKCTIVCISSVLPSNVSTANENSLPFKIPKVNNTAWVNQSEVYNAIQANVAGVFIRNSGLNSIPHINIRGNTNTVVIVDGVRADASILNSLNPADIDHVKVAKGPAASHYLLNN